MLPENNLDALLKNAAARLAFTKSAGGYSFVRPLLGAGRNIVSRPGAGAAAYEMVGGLGRAARAATPAAAHHIVTPGLRAARTAAPGANAARRLVPNPLLHAASPAMHGARQAAGGLGGAAAGAAAGAANAARAAGGLGGAAAGAAAGAANAARAAGGLGGAAAGAANAARVAGSAAPQAAKAMPTALKIVLGAGAAGLGGAGLGLLGTGAAGIGGLNAFSQMGANNPLSEILNYYGSKLTGSEKLNNYDPKNFYLRWRRAGLSGNPLEYASLAMQNPIQAYQMMSGGAQPFDKENYQQYGTMTGGRLVPDGRGGFTPVGGRWTPNADLKALMDSGLDEFDFGRGRGYNPYDTRITRFRDADI